MDYRGRAQLYISIPRFWSTGRAQLYPKADSSGTLLQETPEVVVDETWFSDPQLCKEMKVRILAAIINIISIIDVANAHIQAFQNPSASGRANYTEAWWTAMSVKFQLPKIMELVGLGYSAWLAYRYLLFKVIYDTVERFEEAIENASFNITLQFPL
ncbi:hypothetical protein Tco_1021110 [Tanacetum coccineum]